MNENPFKLGLLDLPESPDLGIRNLSGVFRHTTNSYKFYWFLAILEAVKNDYQQISFDLLTAEMLAQIWFPVHYFKLDFGQTDQLSALARELQYSTDLAINAEREEVRDAALALCLKNKRFKKSFSDKQRYVPTRFLMPWFQSDLKGLNDYLRDRLIISLANESFKTSETSLYKFIQTEHLKGIEISDPWMNYLKKNFRIVRAFVLWHLLTWMQARNPHVPNLPEKLFPPQSRDLKIARKYWDLALTQKYEWHCPYSDQRIIVKNYSLDHFLPWSFVCHDQIWNLIPIPKSVNSSKSDALPDLNTYLPAFVGLQYQALKINLNQKTTSKAIEDYTDLFHCSVDTLKTLTFFDFEAKLKETIQPLEQIAANMGFQRHWIYLNHDLNTKFDK